MAKQRAFLSVSRATFDKLAATAKRLGIPRSILVELAVSKEIGAPLSKQAQAYAAKLAARNAG